MVDPLPPKLQHLLSQAPTFELQGLWPHVQLNLTFIFSLQGASPPPVLLRFLSGTCQVCPNPPGMVQYTASWSPYFLSGSHFSYHLLSLGIPDPSFRIISNPPQLLSGKTFLCWIFNHRFLVVVILCLGVSLMREPCLSVLFTVHSKESSIVETFYRLVSTREGETTDCRRSSFQEPAVCARPSPDSITSCHHW